MDTPRQPQGSEHPSLRASDMDRERVVTLLRESYSEGRLTFDEFQERLDRVYGSRTMEELNVLTADLPSHPAGAVPAPAAPAQSDIARGNRVRNRVLSYVVLMAFLIAIWAASGRHGSFWPIWPILIGGFVLAREVLRLESPGSRLGRHRRERYDGRRVGRVDRRLGDRDEEE